jgi:hypothetical protein
MVSIKPTNKHRAKESPEKEQLMNSLKNTRRRLVIPSKIWKKKNSKVQLIKHLTSKSMASLMMKMDPLVLEGNTEEM